MSSKRSIYRALEQIRKSNGSIWLENDVVKLRMSENIDKDALFEAIKKDKILNDDFVLKCF